MSDLILITTARFPNQIYVEPDVGGWYAVFDKFDNHYVGLAHPSELARVVFKEWRG
jgi:hypothetical protein